MYDIGYFDFVAVAFAYKYNLRNGLKIQYQFNKPLLKYELLKKSSHKNYCLLKNVSISTGFSDIREYSNISKQDLFTNNPYLINKLICENSLEFEDPNPRLLFYDIETYNSIDQTSVPKIGYHSTISMISLVDTRDQITYVFLNQYSELYTADKVTTYLLDSELWKQYDFNIKIINYDCEQDMCREFLYHLKSYKDITICSGFNSSMGNRHDTYLGYDLPFIMFKANLAQLEWQLIKKNGFRSLYNTYDQSMITQIRGIPNLYFYDYKFLYSVLGKDIYHFENYRLSDYLNYYKIESKMNQTFTYYELQRDTMNRDCDISKYIAYCIMDCFLLYILEIKSSFIIDKIPYMSQCNVPLHFALYFSNGSIANSCIIQRYYKAGYLLQQKNIKFQYNGYEGAYTETHEGIYNDVIQLDVKGMYPSIIIAYNISLETLRVNSNLPLKSIRINDKEISKQYPILSYVISDEKLGIIPSLCLELISRREFIKKNKLLYNKNSIEFKQLSKQEKVIKVTNNSIYGSFGFKSSAIYNPLCAVSVTSVGRYIIQTIRDKLIDLNHRIVSIDTDGIFITLNRDYIRCENEFNKFINGMNKYCVRKFNTDKIQFECTEFYARVYAPSKKKSYIYLKYNNLNDFLNRQNIIENEVGINGIGWSQYSTEYIKNQIIDFFKQILLDSMTKDQIVEHSNKFINFHIDRIESLQKTNNIHSLKDYSRRIKLGTKLGIILKDKYNLSNNIDYFVSLIRKRNIKKRDLLIPLYSKYNNYIHTLDIKAMIEFIHSPIKKFFIKPDITELLRLRHEIYDNEDDSSKLYVRIEEPNTSMRFQLISVDDLYQDIQSNEKCSYHEIIENQYNRAFFDIDDDSKTFNIDDFKLFIFNFISYYGRMGIATASSDTKISYHVVLQDLIIDLRYNEIIARKFNLHSSRSYCDISIYSINKSLRLPLTYKVSNNQYIRKLELVDSEFKDLIIKNIEDIDETPTPFYYNDDSIFNVPSSTLSLDSEAIKIIDKYIQDNNMILISTSNGFVRAKYTNDCLICNRKHDNDNQYFKHSGGKIVLCCYRNDHEDEKKDNIIIQKLPNKISNFVDDMSNRLELVKNYYEYNICKQVNEKYINYEIKQHKQLFISSALGTGKTECLLKQIKPTDTILVITFRRTFATDFTRRMNDYGLNAVNYLDQDRKSYDNYKFPILCLQIDSLHKYHKSRPLDILICDEIESILSQLKNVKDRNAHIELFFNFINSAKHSIFMDGHMNQSTINLIQYITNYPVMCYIKNTYKPKTDYKCFIRPIDYHGTRDYKMFCKVFNYLKNNLKVAMMCSSENELSAITQLINKYLPNKNIKVYSGKDGKVMNGSTQKEIKLKDFTIGVNKVIVDEKIDLLIYTSTITGGISIDIEYFDHFIGCLFNQTADILSFIQAIHRVRSIKCRYIEIYFHHVKSYLPCTMNQYNAALRLEDYSVDEKLTTVEMFLRTRDNAMKVYSSELLLKHLFAMGYDITIENIEDITNEDITENVFKKTLEDVNDKRVVKKILTDWLNDETSLKIILSKTYYEHLIDSFKFDRLIKEQKIDTIYRDKVFAELCKLAMFDINTITTPEILYTQHNILVLKHIITNLDNYRIRFFNQFKDDYIKELNKVKYHYEQCRTMSAIPADTVRVVDRVDAIRKMKIASDLENMFEIDVRYSSEEFNNKVDVWINSIKDVYPDIKHTKETIKLCNRFLAYKGLEINSERIRDDGDRNRYYYMTNM